MALTTGVNEEVGRLCQALGLPTEGLVSFVFYCAVEDLVRVRALYEVLPTPEQVAALAEVIGPDVTVEREQVRGLNEHAGLQQVQYEGLP